MIIKKQIFEFHQTHSNYKIKNFNDKTSELVVAFLV